MAARPLLVALVLAGCSMRPSLTLRREEKPADTIVAASEDGSHYVRVEGGVLSSGAGLLREWKRAAEKTCEGEYMVLSDAAFERKKAGVVVSRSHEGYVRCIVGDPDPKDGAPPDRRIGSAR